MALTTFTQPQPTRVALRDPSPDAARRRPQARPARPALKVVPAGYRSPRRRRLQRRLLAVMVVLAVLGAPFALVLVHIELTANQLRLTSLQTRGDQAQEQYEKLQLQVAQLESPARVVATAQQLGMVTPTTIHYLTASAGTATADTGTSGGPGVGGWASAKRVDTGR